MLLDAASNFVAYLTIHPIRSLPSVDPIWRYGLALSGTHGRTPKQTLSTVSVSESACFHVRVRVRVRAPLFCAAG